MSDQENLGRVAPGKLAGARDLAHKAVQWATKAARANLEAAPDDSHSNLGWDPKHGAFRSQPIPNDGGTCFIGFAIADCELFVVRDGQDMAQYKLAGKTDADAGAWLDGQLTELGLKPATSVALPYEMPASAEQIGTYAPDAVAEELKVLAAWYSLADTALTAFAKENDYLHPGPSPVRCWPHHFDYATYVSLEEGDFETARGVGVGMSPGDESYAEPYFYINPWPHLDKASLPQLPAPGHWHTEGFVGAIATASEILSLSGIPGELSAFIDAAFAAGRESHGA